jgi:hypothetical protein
MSDINYTNNQLNNTPGKAARVEVVSPIEVDIDLSSIELDLSEINVDLTSIEGSLDNLNTGLGEVKGELETVNTNLGEVKTAIESLEIDIDLSTLETNTGEIKTEVETANGFLGEIKVEIEGSNTLLGEVKAAVEALEIEVDLSTLETTTGEIKTELESANTALGEIKTAVEAIELDVDFADLETAVGEIKSEVEAGNVILGEINTGIASVDGHVLDLEQTVADGFDTLSRQVADLTKGTIRLWDIPSGQIGATYTADPLVSVNTENKALFSIKIKNTGANPLDFEVRRKAKWSAQIEYVYSSQDAVAPGESAEMPIDGTAFDGRYSVYIKSADGTSALVETIIKTGPHSQLPYECDWTVGTGGDFATLADAFACVTVKDGDRLLLLKGTYNLPSTYTIDRPMSLVGEDRDAVVIQNDPAWTNGMAMISVTADGVSFENLTLRQTSSNANAFVVSASKAGETRLQGFSLIKCNVEYTKHAVAYRAANSVLYDCYFEVIGASTAGTKYGAFPLGNAGNSFIDSCTFDHPFSLTSNGRTIYMGGLGSAGAENVYNGSFSITRNKSEGLCVQFVNHDALNGTNSLDIIVAHNEAAETNAFFVSIGTNPDVYSRAVFFNNKLTNIHAAGPTGKGMLYFDSNNIRATPMPFFASGNELQNLVLRATEVNAENAPAGECLATVKVAVADAYVAAGRNPVAFSTRIPRRLPKLNLPIWGV